MLAALGVLPRFDKGGTINPLPGVQVTATHAEHSSALVWHNPGTDKDETHYGANPLGKGTPEEYMQALGSAPVKVSSLNPGKKVEF